MNSLPLFFRLNGRKVVVIGEGDGADAKRRLVERAGGICVTEHEAHHAALGFVVLDDEHAAAAAAMRLRAKGLIVNVTDRPALCDFTVPSIVDRDPVLIAVGTGGASAGLAKMLRLRVERWLPQGLGSLAKALRNARAALRQRYPDAAARRRALDDALAEGGALDPMVDHGDTAVEDWLSGTGHRAQNGAFDINLTSADADDLTLRQARLLGSADVVEHDADVPDAILIRARADAVRVPLRDAAAPDTDVLTVRLRMAGRQSP